MADVLSGPTFSLVIAVRNGAATIQRCLDSVYAQDVQLAEIVVMDAASSDGTVEILERNESSIGYWESMPDRGINHAWNKALGHVSGDWVVFLGADDQLASPHTLAGASALLAGLGVDVDVAYGRVEIVAGDGTTTGAAGQPWVKARADFYEFNTIPHQAVFHRRNLFERVGPFDERFRILGDYELLIRAFKVGPPEYLDLVVAKFAAGGLSDRPEMSLSATREAYQARYVNGLERLPELIAPRVLRARCFDIIRRTLGPAAARSLADRYHGRSKGS